MLIDVPMAHWGDWAKLVREVVSKTMKMRANMLLASVNGVSALPFCFWTLRIATWGRLPDDFPQSGSPGDEC